MFAPEAVRRGQGDGARDPARRPDRHGELDPQRPDARRADPEDQLRLLAAPAGRLRQPDDLGSRERRHRALHGARASPEENISFERDTYTFDFPGTPADLVAEFRDYYGPTMNAFEAAADERARRPSSQAELDALFNAQNTSPSADSTSIPATFLRVTVRV